MAHGAFYHRGPAEVKRLIIEALQEHFAEHPAYSDPDGPGIVIKNKYARSERHKRQIVVTTASASPQRLGMSADFGGPVYSSVVLGRLQGRKGTAVEWALENPFQKIRPRPGIYLIDLETDETFIVTPYYAVEHEILFPYIDRGDGDKVKAKLKHKPVEAESEFLMLDDHLPLEKGTDYDIDYDSGIVTFTGPILDARLLAAEYRWIGQTGGPFAVARQVYNLDALPGVILNFGRKVSAGSQQAVVVRKRPEYIADFWTGRWTVSINLDIYTQDPIEQDELTEEIAMVFWYWNTERWADQGMSLVGPPEITGGAEEPEDEIAGEILFRNSVSLTVIVDWEAFVPSLRRLRAINTVGYTVSPFDPPITALKKDRDAGPDGQFGNIADRDTLPGKGMQPVRDLRKYFAGPKDPKLGRLYMELLNFNPKEASDALGQYYGSVDPANPSAPDSPVNIPEAVPPSEFVTSPDTGDEAAEPGVFSDSRPLSLDELPDSLREQLRRISRGG